MSRRGISDNPVTNMLVGGAVCLAGVVITAISYLSAQPGSEYMIFYGAVAVGGVQFLVGVAQVVTRAAKGQSLLGTAEDGPQTPHDVARLQDPEDFAPLRRARALLADAQDQQALNTLRNALADVHKRNSAIRVDLTRLLLDEMFAIYTKHEMQASFAREEYQALVRGYHAEQQQLMQHVHTHGVEQALPGMPSFGTGLPEHELEEIRGIETRTKTLNAQIADVLSGLPMQCA